VCRAGEHDVSGHNVGVVGPILEEASELTGCGYRLGYSPERIDPGNETHTFVNTPKVTSGADAASLEVVDAFFAALVVMTRDVIPCHHS
jgi:UDP-N-acetyl-D-glucosamine dehydrogenase